MSDTEEILKRKLNVQELKQPTPPQRKKPGRKPNPASPALRKAQNRAAQRAFRERKERHLKDLENTIKSLRESQYQSAVKTYRESQQLRSLVERLRNENLYWKQVSVNFEVLLNNLYGGTDATSKIKDTVLSRIQFSSPSLNPSSNPLLNNQMPIEMSRNLQSFQLINNNVCSFLSPPNSTISLSPESSVTKSPPTSPGLDLNDNNLDSSTIPANISENFDGSELSKPFILPKSNNEILINNDLSTPTSDLIVQNSELISDCIIDDNYGIFTSNVDGSRDIYPNSITNFNNSIVLTKSEISSDLFKELDQCVRLAKLVGITDFYNTPVNPKLKYPLTEAQLSYLELPHDRRIDLIPCLHLRSRMIQYQNNFDLYDLIELLITKSICHGDPLDPDSWQLPEEFFSNYKYLVFQHCRLKSTLYQMHGQLPQNFADTYETMLTRK
ncbi:5701_t:CDS:2, partial [Scutellospora calospora]